MTKGKAIWSAQFDAMPKIEPGAYGRVITRDGRRGIYDDDGDTPSEAIVYFDEAPRNPETGLGCYEVRRRFCLRAEPGDGYLNWCGLPPQP